MKRFHGFEVDTATHENEHLITAFPGCEGALISFNAFYLGKQYTRGSLRLCKGGDGQSPKAEKANDSLGFEASDGNVHGLFVVGAHRQAKECRNQHYVSNEGCFLPCWTVVPSLFGVKWVEGQGDTR